SSATARSHPLPERYCATPNPTRGGAQRSTWPEDPHRGCLVGPVAAAVTRRKPTDCRAATSSSRPALITRSAVAGVLPPGGHRAGGPLMPALCAGPTATSRSYSPNRIEADHTTLTLGSSGQSRHQILLEPSSSTPSIRLVIGRSSVRIRPRAPTAGQSTCEAVSSGALIASLIIPDARTWPREAPRFATWWAAARGKPLQP